MTARILQFGPVDHNRGEDGRQPEPRFEASVHKSGSIRVVIGGKDGEQEWFLTPRQAVELAAFLNNEWVTAG